MYQIRWKKVFALAVALGFLVLLIRGCAYARQNQEIQMIPELVTLRPAETTADEHMLTVYDHTAQKSCQMELESYLVGVLAAEMPASFDGQALRAQAVAARTYTYYNMLRGGCNSQDADICTWSACCQAYHSDAALREKWGDDYGTYILRIKSAVEDTKGEILLYDGQPIEALYHSSAGGMTENSEDAFSSARPYLRAVSSTLETGSARITGEVRVPVDTFIETVLVNWPEAGLEADRLGAQIAVTLRTESGRVSAIRLGLATASGRDMRRLFSLNSTLFTVEVTDGAVVFSTKGFGHGVGMSQTGANAMGRAGSDYREILLHYYSGVSFGTIEDIE